MRWREPLISGRLVRRYKRFLADVALEDGREVTVHCPNPGRLLGLDAPGSRVWLSKAPGVLRKLPLTMELIEADGGLVGINTMHPNRLVDEALRAGKLPELAGYGEIRREVRYDERCRIDLLLQGEGRPDCYVEIKNVHLRRGRGAEFPDCPTLRGAKHLRALTRMVANGSRAVLFYVVQRMDCRELGIASDIDPVYGAAFRSALAGGVECVCRACEVGLDGIRLGAPMPVAA
jgi:sugar fermentation stimulation protein A